MSPFALVLGGFRRWFFQGFLSTHYPVIERGSGWGPAGGIGEGV